MARTKKNVVLLTKLYLIVFVFIGLSVSAENEIKPTPENKLIIVTSFPEEMSAIYKAAFEEKYPSVSIEILNKKTTEGLKFIEKNQVDLFWVSAPDAFEVLKKKNLLQVYRPQEENIPKRISGYPVNEPNGFYSGFAMAGYGIMWNKDYLKAHDLKPPKEWIDLTRPEYQGHIGLSTPSRSGTTHLTIEAILQLKGWKMGWGLIKAIAANSKAITQKSSDVPQGVISGEFGIGIVIDYYGLTAKASDSPVEFTYPSATVFVPSSIALLKESQQPELAKKFIDFLLSKNGQKLLIHPHISRLPVSPEVYKDDSIPVGYPQPFRSIPLGSHTAFDVHKSRLRYNLVNSLFDVMITYRIDELKAAVISLQRAEKQLLLSTKVNNNLAGVLVHGRDLINYLPIKELTSYDPKFTKKFNQKRKKTSDVIKGEQGEIEATWDAKIRTNYLLSKEIAETVL